MKKQGVFKLARQIGSMGAFAKVCVEIEPAENFSISFAGCEGAGGLAGDEAAVSFGISVAREKLYGLRPPFGPHLVRVLAIHTMPCDSTVAFVAYAAAKAYYKALGRSEEPMTLDFPTRRVSI